MVRLMGDEMPGWMKAGFVLALGIAFAGIADYAFAQAGYDALGTLAWVAGYGGAVIIIWMVWLRHLEFEPGG